jgi:hypothetical protein
MTARSIRNWLTALAVAASSAALAQHATEKIPVPLSDPGRPAFLKVGLIAGGITVRGYAGKEVIVEVSPEQADEEIPKGKAEGKMRLIPNTSVGLTAEEEDNTVTVSAGLGGMSRRTDLVIQVPSSCSMKLSTVNEGDITVENVSGDLEVNNTNGSITLRQIAGSAVAQTVNGEVKVSFTQVNAAKAMSFSSLNGDIDVTFPASLKATVRLKSDQGEIYSDFDVQMQKSEARVDRNEKGGGKYRVTLEKAMQGTINGGGQEIQFSNFNGDIYIRKGG